MTETEKTTALRLAARLAAFITEARDIALAYPAMFGAETADLSGLGVKVGDCAYDYRMSLKNGLWAFDRLALADGADLPDYLARETENLINTIL